MPNDRFNFNQLTESLLFTSDEEIKWMIFCFEFFKTNDSGIGLKNFERLLKDLFFNYDPMKKETLFNIFDINKDGIIDFDEFQFMWVKWIRIILKPKNALLVMDLQNDFISGSLSISKFKAKHDGYEILSLINNLIKKQTFDVTVYTQDWHPPDHISFYENAQNRNIVKIREVDSDIWKNFDSSTQVKIYDSVIFDIPPEIEQKLWPNHCVQNTWGAALHKDLYIDPKGIRVFKGTQSHVDSYSIFFNNATSEETHLNEKLKQLEITDIYICGIAYDVCVAATANDAIQLNYRTIVIDEICRGIDQENIEKTKLDLTNKNCAIVNLKEVIDMLSGKCRRFDLGLSLALSIQKTCSPNKADPVKKLV